MQNEERPIFEASFKGRKYKYQQGRSHPEDSLNTFKDEQEIMEKFWDIKEDDDVIDVGSSYGSYSLPALALGANVIAFEPNQAIFDDLCSNVILNGMQAIMINAGLWSEECELAYQEEFRTVVTGANDRTVKMLTLDNVCNIYTIPKIDIVKVDVEGAELEVLKGATKTIEKYHPKMLVEDHGSIKPLQGYMDSHSVSSTVESMLLHWGYKVQKEPYKGRLFLFAS